MKAWGTTSQSQRFLDHLEETKQYAVHAAFECMRLQVRAYPLSGIALKEPTGCPLLTAIRERVLALTGYGGTGMGLYLSHYRICTLSAEASSKTQTAIQIHDPYTRHPVHKKKFKHVFVFRTTLDISYTDFVDDLP